MKRICIYPKDIVIITGRSERFGRNLLKKIREHLNKEKYQPVTVDEFCQYMGLKSEQVESLIK